MSDSNYEHEVPVKYIRTLDPKLLPPRVGHNWCDSAFRMVQERPQQLEGEFRGKRLFLHPGVYDHTPPEGLGHTAQQLMQALSTRRADGPVPDGRPVFTTLSDKVLRFYAFFSEKAPEGCCEECWYRCVVINFYPEDDTVLIQEPPIPNSGFRGGTFLKRQKVRADPRQREQFPNDEYLTINHFNVGDSVRINAVEFFLYDCDAFTRDFLTEIGVVVCEPLQCPNSFMSQWKLQREQKLTANYGVASHNYHKDDAVRAARFVMDAGKVLRFYGVLDERSKPTSGAVRKLELLYYVEDDSIAVVERPTTNESVPSLFLSRGWLPKTGSIEKTLEFTFAHRVNGMREPYLGQAGCYKAQDLTVGATINVLGRSVFLYDCDDFTRSYYMETFGVELAGAVDCATLYGIPPKRDTVTFRSNSTPASVLAAAGSKVDGSETISKKGDVLRFLLRLAAPCTSAARMRRFTLTYYTATGECMVYESPIKNSGYVGGCFSGRSRLPHPSGGQNAYYSYEDFKVGSTILVNAHKFDVMGMDEHTANFLACKGETPLNDQQLQLLVDAFRLFLRTRFHSFRDAFLGFDRDKDSVISVTEFVDHVTYLQITDRRMDAQALFDSITRCPETGYLTMETFVDWISQKEPENSGEAKRCQPVNVDEQALMRKALRQFCERLEARCLNSLQMFRLASTMPRAYSGRSADCYSLTNPHRDAYITPVQLRRCIEEVLGGNPLPRELDALLSFFFPALPWEEYRERRDLGLTHSLDLKNFQMKYQEMCTLQQLPQS